MLEIGHITRGHGLRGEVVVHLLTTELSRLHPGTVLFAGERELVVETSRPHQRNWVVRFEGVGSRDAADELRGVKLFAGPLEEPDGPGDDELWVHELIGAEVVDLDGLVYGRVDSVQDNPASDLLVLESGALVPLTFVEGWEVRGERLRIDPPPGLFDV